MKLTEDQVKELVDHVNTGAVVSRVVSTEDVAQLQQIAHENGFEFTAMQKGMFVGTSMSKADGKPAENPL